MPRDGALLHFDVEFTHPVPGLGQPMQFGFVAQPARFMDDGTIHADREAKELDVMFPVTSSARVTSWVRENQSELLSKCQRAAREGVLFKKQRDHIVTFLRGVQESYGEHIVPCGWTIGSDMAYLLHVLGEDCSLVHYDAIDLTSVMIGKSGRIQTYDEIRRELGIGRVPSREHNALYDARDQSMLVLAALKI